jgi:hypothetical protein
MPHDIPRPIIDMLRRLPREELEHIAGTAALGDTHRVVTGEIPETLKVLRAAGYSDEEIRIGIAQACAELGFTCGGS